MVSRAAAVTMAPGVDDHRQGVPRCHGHAAPTKWAERPDSKPHRLPIMVKHDLWTPRQVPYRVLAGRGS